MGEQGALQPQAPHLQPQQHTHHRIGQRADPPAQAVADGHAVIDELDGHGVHQGVGGHLQPADHRPHQGGLPQAHARGEPVPGPRPQREHQGEGDDPLQRHLRVAVGEAPQQGLAHNPRQTAHRRHQSRLPVGEAPLQQQGGLVGHNGGEHGPKSRLHQNIVQVQPPDGRGLSLQFQAVHSVVSKLNMLSRPVLLAVYRVSTRSGSSSRMVSIRSPEK